ncbi:MAG TPA: class I SAM-dependent methyltransferase, partial [Pyrinomonadaceae bacterium]|nr:class I SAM-dependent methyltransferase [Pyrinomonadaceae bacterium]
MDITRSLRNLRTWWSFPRRRRINPSAVVLDVGCGCAPNMRSNILADKFLLDDSERSQPLSIDERPFIMCDALYLPFKDGSVDYVICSHVAEHLEDPEVLLAELSRVASAGYVECPGRIREMFHGWDYHRWYVHVEDGQLVFEEKPGPLHDPELHEWSARLFETDPVFEQFFLDNMERLGLVTAYDWVGRIKSIVRRLPG